MLDVTEIFTEEDERLNEILANVPPAEDDYFPAGFDGIDQSSVGAKSIATEDFDDGAQGDFLDEARKLVDQGKAKTMTEAIRKVHHERPELLEALKSGAVIPPGQQFRQNQKFIDLCRRHKLCLEQYERAKKAGHSKIATGILKFANENLLELRKLLAE